VKLISPEGRHTVARALMDKGSELSFVRESLVQALGLQRHSKSILLTGIGAQKRGRVTLKIQSYLQPNLEFSLETHVLPKLTGRVPGQEVAVHRWEHLSGLELADPLFAVPAKVDLLLGANIYGRLLMEDIRRGDPDSPVAQKTALGWIISGPTSPSSSDPREFQGRSTLHVKSASSMTWLNSSGPRKSSRLQRVAACLRKMQPANNTLGLPTNAPPTGDTSCVSPLSVSPSSAETPGKLQRRCF